MKRSLLLIAVVALSSSFHANAGWLSEIKKEMENKGKEEVKQRVATKLDQYCLKIPFTNNYYLCPPVSPDLLDQL